MSVVAKGFFERGQQTRELKDKELGPFTVLNKIGAKSYRLELPSILRLH
jgi:hypothetical protein